MAAEPTTFTVGDLTFIVPRLKPKQALRGGRLVSGVIMPAMAEAAASPEKQVGAAVQRAVESLDCLPELLDLFSANAQYVSDGSQGTPPRASPTALKPFVDDVFTGRPEWVVEFVAQCVKAEYSGFLGAGGLVGSLLAQAQATMAVPSSSPKSSPPIG